MDARILNDIINDYKGNWPTSISADAAQVYLSHAQRLHSSRIVKDSLKRTVSAKSKKQTGQTILYFVPYDDKLYFVDTAGIVASFTKDERLHTFTEWTKEFVRRDINVNRVLYTHLGDNLFLEPMLKSISELIEEVQSVRQVSELERKRQKNKHRIDVEKSRREKQNRMDRIQGKIWFLVTQYEGSKPRGVGTQTWSKFQEISDKARRLSVDAFPKWYRSLHYSDKFIVDEVVEAIS